MTALWLDPTFGASGDMLLGALVGLGTSLDQIRRELSALAVDGWALSSSPVTRAGIGATKVDVALIEGDGPPPHRSWSRIDRLLADADLPTPVAEGARSTFRALAEAEAKIHQVDLDAVHFHEVGAVDAIVDIVGAWSALNQLGVDSVTVGPVGLGSGGTVGAAHGRLPLPAPATLELLTGAPVTGLDLTTETVTPTGAALLTTMASGWGPLPSGRLVATARGAGGRDPSTHPNVVTATVIEEIPGPAAGARWEARSSVVVSTNVDDVTPEVLGYTIDRLLDAGADDAWVVPIVMKRSRPAHELRVLCRPDLLDDLAAIVFAETGTLGLRVTPATKRVAARRFDQVTIRGHRVAIKVGPSGAKPEHRDLVAVARATAAPIRVLAAEALAAHRSAETGRDEDLGLST